MFLGILSILIGYLLGSIPTAYIVTKISKGVDIRKIDVGNVGASATFRQVGLLGGAIVAIVDIGKGAASVAIAHFGFQTLEPWVLAAGFAAFVGHCYPVYIGFKGGQGTATLIGTLFVLSPLATAIMLLLLIIALIKVHRVFPSIIVVSPLLLPVIWLITGSLNVLIYCIVIMAIMIFRNLRGIKTEYQRLKNYLHTHNRKNEK